MPKIIRRIGKSILRILVFVGLRIFKYGFIELLYQKKIEILLSTIRKISKLLENSSSLSKIAARVIFDILLLGLYCTGIKSLTKFIANEIRRDLK